MFASPSLEPTNDVPDAGVRGVPLDTSKQDRLAEFVHHLGNVSMRDARRAIHHSSAPDDDPLSTVASALLALRWGAIHPADT